MQAAQDPAVVVSTVTMCDIAATEFKKLRKAMRNLGDIPSDSELHRLRIKAKRARYAAELAGNQQGKAGDEVYSAGQGFSGSARRTSGCGPAKNISRQFTEQSRSVRTAFVAGRMVERQRQRRDSARSAFKSQWKKLKKRGQKAWG